MIIHGHEYKPWTSKQAFSQHGPVRRRRRLTPLLSDGVKLPLILLDVEWRSRAVAEVCPRRPFGNRRLQSRQLSYTALAAEEDLLTTPGSMLDTMDLGTEANYVDVRLSWPLLIQHKGSFPTIRSCRLSSQKVKAGLNAQLQFMLHRTCETVVLEGIVVQLGVE